MALSVLEERIGQVCGETGGTAASTLLDYRATGSVSALEGPIGRLVDDRLDAGLGASELFAELGLLNFDPELIGRILKVFEHRRDRRIREAAGRDERRRLGQNLHDSLAQSVYGLGLLADAMGMSLQLGRTAAAQKTQREISASAREILAELRVQIYELLPAALERDGLEGAIRSRLAAVENRAGVRTSLEVEGRERPPGEVEAELLGVLRELLNNSLKHSRSRSVAVVLRQSSSIVELEVSDDGVGFVESEGRSSGGLGLSGIDGRVERLGARLSFESVSGRGTRARVTVPIDVRSSRMAK